MAASQCVMRKQVVPSTCTAIPSRARRSLVAASAVPRSNSEPVGRRVAAGLLVALPALVSASAAVAKPEANESPAEKRKAALKATAQSIKETGEDKDTFPESNYAVSEDKSPNVHTRQEEGMRKS